jgi:hypothetical protein
MALQKQITNLRTGHANTYWRLTAISIDALSGHLQLVLSGYASDAARQAGRMPDDQREWMFGPAVFAGIVQTPAQGETLYDVNAIAAYHIIRTTRRPMPSGALMQPNGDALLPTGELIAAADIEGMPDAPTIPSEFADALDV